MCRPLTTIYSNPINVIGTHLLEMKYQQQRQLTDNDPETLIDSYVLDNVVLKSAPSVNRQTVQAFQQVAFIKPLKSDLRHPISVSQADSSIFLGVVALYFVPSVNMKLVEIFPPCRLTGINAGNMLLYMIASDLSLLLAFFFVIHARVTDSYTGSGNGIKLFKKAYIWPHN